MFYFKLKQFKMSNEPVPNAIDYSFQTLIQKPATFTPSVTKSWNNIAKDTVIQEDFNIYLTDANLIPDFNVNDKENNTAKLLNLMTGVDILSGENQSNNFSQNYATVDTGRIQRFFNFWNRIKNPTDLGNIFSKFTGTGTDPSTNYDVIFRSRNVFVTFILSLVFEALMSTADGNNIITPLDIFTEPINPFFCPASEKLRQFVTATSGIGNFPIFTNGNDRNTTRPSVWLKTYYNRGYMSKFCGSIFVKECPENKKIPNPYDNQKCIQDYRTKISNSPTALSWCGCFAPLPDWTKSIYTRQNPNAAPGSITNKNFPNVCDNLCFGPENETIIKIYEPDFVTNTGVNSGQPVPCVATICVIDDNAVNAVNSSGNVNFDQICPAPPGGITECYLDVTKPGVLDNVSGANGQGMLSQTLFRQDCPNAACYTINDVTGVRTITKCNEINTPSTGDLFRNNINGLSGVEEYERIYSGFWDGVIIIIFLLIFFELAYIEVHRYMQRSKLL
jgi:hypothetical protein